MAEPRTKLDLDALVFAQQLRVLAQAAPEPKIVTTLTTVERDKVQVMCKLDPFSNVKSFSRSTQWAYCTSALPTTRCTGTTACAGIATAISSIGFALSRNRRASDVLHVERKLVEDTRMRSASSR